MKFPVFDLHCDTALALLGSNLFESGSLLKNTYHIDIERGMKFPGYAQCFACFTAPYMEKQYGKSPVTVFELELATIMREVEKNKQHIRIAYEPKDIVENYQKGIISAILSLEGPAGIEYDPALLEDLYKIGFRISTLSWNEKNPLTGSHLTGGGLTDLGREYVRQAQRLGILVDVSHISDEGFWDIMNITQAPIIASHSNSRFVCDHSRNLTDDMFLAVCNTGGVVGINMYADFLGNKPDLNTVAEHIVHFMELDPSGKHIALGGDLDGCDKLPDGMEGLEHYPVLAEHLLNRGLSYDQICDIFWNNALEVFNYAVCINKK